MDEDKEIQILLKKTPAFTVLKNGSILKNIFLLRKPPPFNTEQPATDASSRNQESDEEILLVGRHPDCNVTLEHPSISRYHLRIHSNPSSQMLSVVDLSSVHGTWVSGKRIEPGIPVKLKEGDTVKMGGSSRVYELHWVPLSQAFDVNNPFVPATFIKRKETQEESCSYPETLQTSETPPSDEDLDSSNLSISNKNHHSSCNDTEVEEQLSPSKTDNQNGEIFSTNSVQSPLASGTITEIENQSESSIGDDQVEEHSSPSKTDNQNGAVSVQTPFDVSESLSKTEIFDSLKKSEDLVVALLDDNETDMIETDIGSENELVNLQKVDTDSVSVVLLNDVIRHEDVSFTPDEFEQMNQTKMTNESDSMVLCTSIISREVDMGVKIESIDEEITKKKMVFMDLLDETDMDQERVFTSEISRDNEVSRTIFDNIDGNELEFFTPDKENRDPNYCSLRTLRKRWKEDENKELNSCTMLMEDVSLTVNEEEKAIFDMSVNGDEVFSSEKETKSSPITMEAIGNSINYPQTVQKDIDSSNNFLGGTKKRWTMVLDTNTLLHKNSLKHLKLLQGLKETQLFIPKIVYKELKDIESQHNLLNRTTKKVSLALKWIEECMITTKWWIHMDDDIETEFKVLEIARHLCKETKDGKIIILSNDVTLKVKSMAEGIMCEEAEVFFKSLVNPFSERFMWIGSMARGLTWSCVDDDVLRQKYEGFCFNESYRLKGLKLLARV